jgi:hypothetical protein
LLDIATFHAEQVTSGLKTFMDERLVSAGMFQADDVSVVVTGASLSFQFCHGSTC